jgi:hypothetical protein
MTRAYIRLDPDYAERKEHYPDGAFVALTALLCAGANHSKRGVYKSEKLVRVLLGKRARWIPYLIEQGDLVLRDDASIYIDGWEEWQEGNWKVAERMARVRAKRHRNRNPKRNPVSNPGSNSLFLEDNDNDNDNDGSSVTTSFHERMSAAGFDPEAVLGKSA